MGPQQNRREPKTGGIFFAELLEKGAGWRGDWTEAQTAQWYSGGVGLGVAGTREQENPDAGEGRRRRGRS